MSGDAPTHLAWLDFETTGLEPKTHLPLEAAVIVTTVNLDEVHRYEAAANSWRGRGISLFRMDDIDPAVKAMHEDSGLFDALGDGHPWLDIARALTAITKRYEGAYLAGSGVHFERVWLREWAPHTLEHLHYRNLDVSPLRTFCALYAPEAKYEPAKAHRAMADVEDAIAELRHYRDRLGIPYDAAVQP